jgi:hypothetical protein
MPCNSEYNSEKLRKKEDWIKRKKKTRDEILGQNTRAFSSMLFTVSQSLLLADFKENSTLIWFSCSLQNNRQNKKTRVFS